MLPSFFDFLRGLTSLEAALLALLENALVCAGALALGALCLRSPRPRVGGWPPSITLAERVLAVVTVLVNSLITWLGWRLWLSGIIRIGSAGVVRSLLDAVLLLAIMDVCMYVSHRAAHVPVVFRYVHAIHHRFDAPRPLTLFVMHPVEAFGFGALWLTVLWLYPASFGGIVVYLTLNLVFGVVGHLGQEPWPLPRVWSRVLGTATFHGNHHRSPEKNYGFYTQLWDRLLRSGG